MKIYKNYINGEWVESKSNRTFEDRNPADTREVLGVFQKSCDEDIQTAIASGAANGLSVSAISPSGMCQETSATRSFPPQKAIVGSPPHRAATSRAYTRA